MADDDAAPGADTFRWDGPLPAPEFVMVPKLVHQQILRHLSGSEFKVFYALLVRAYEWGHEDAELSLNAISATAGVARSVVQTSVKTLVGMGLIEVIRHQSAVHGHEANTYRVMVTDDPRYVDRHPIPKSGIAGMKSGRAYTEDRPRSRARSFQGKNTQEDPPTPFTKYTTGRDAVCATCGARPCVCGNA